MTGRGVTDNEPSPERRGKRFAFRLVALVLGLIVGLIVAEIALRIVGYSSPQFYEADETLGHKLIPNLSGWYTREGRNFVTINSHGFHDADHTIEKPVDVFRVAIIGDSYVEAFQLRREESFANFIAGECSGFDDKRVEVLSFGVSGYGTAQELILLREKVIAFSPDIVMLVVTTNNDISDNVRELKQTPIPFYIVQNDKLVLDDSFRTEQGFIVRSSALGRAGTWFENQLRFVQAIREITRKVKDWKRSRPVEATQNKTDTAVAPVIEVGIDSQVYREPTDEIWQNAWRVTEAIILETNKEVAASGAKFVVVTASNGVQVLPNVNEREAFANLLGVDDLFYPDNRIAEFCKTNSISVITLAPMLAEHAAREKANLHGFEGNIGYGHWNQLGHAVAGKTISRELCTKFCGR